MGNRVALGLSLLALTLTTAPLRAESTAPQQPGNSIQAVPAGRLLASNCFQCHGTNGTSKIGFERLAGKSAQDIYEELQEMRAEDRPDIMDYHARGYTNAQLRLIASYFASQR